MADEATGIQFFFMKKISYCLVILMIAGLCVSQEMSKGERKNVNRYLKDLKNKDESVRYDAVESLRYYKYPEVATALSVALSDSSARVRNRAALSLYELKEAARPAIPALKQSMQDSDPWVRINAGAALFNLKEGKQGIISAISELLKHPEPRVQVAAARFLLGEVPFTDLMPVLTAGLKSLDPEVRVDASKEFDDADQLPASALAVLVDSLNDSNADVRKNAASALTKFKTKGTTALPALVRSLKDQDASVRSEAVDAITSMGTWARVALPALHDVIVSDTDAGVRRNAVRSLEWIDPEGKESMPMLLDALKDRDAEVRERALETMLSFRPFPVSSVPSVQAVLGSETNDDVKRLLERIIERSVRDKEFNSSIKSGTPGKRSDTGMQKSEAEKLLQEKGIQMTSDELWGHVNEGDAPVVKALLAAGISPNSERQGMSVLMIAVSTYQGAPEQKEIIQAMIEYGADLNYKTANGTTPFFEAAGKCDPGLLLAMIKAGAILEVKAKGGATTMTEAAMANKIENVRLLLKAGYKLKNEPAWLMSSTKNPEILTLLRRAGGK